MPKLSAYLMNPQTEIALARSAAPPSISQHATVLVLTPRGYVTAAKGNNGFTCLVERPWMQAFDASSFWNPRMRAPVCYNAEASRTILPYTLKRTALALSGATEAQIFARIKSAIAARVLPTPQPGAMAYMMSKQQYLNDGAKAWHPHLMFYEPARDAASSGADWGADRKRSPVMFDSQHHAMPEPWALFFVPVAHWSDGSAALLR